MRRKGGVVVPAVIVCFTLVWVSVSSAWAGTGFRPLAAHLPGKGAVDYLASKLVPTTVATVRQQVVRAAEELAVVTAEVTIELFIAALLLGMVPIGRTTMTAEQSARIAQAEFDH